MKKKELAEIKAKEVKDLRKLVGEKKKEIVKLIPQVKAGKEKNLKKAAKLRHEIAQILTVMKEKELSGKEKNENVQR